LQPERRRRGSRRVASLFDEIIACDSLTWRLSLELDTLLCLVSECTTSNYGLLWSITIKMPWRLF
jgi:hypothetical protein